MHCRCHFLLTSIKNCDKLVTQGLQVYFLTVAGIVLQFAVYIFPHNVIWFTNSLEITNNTVFPSPLSAVMSMNCNSKTSQNLLPDLC